MKEKDVLVVYLSAIGVSEDGTAYLLCRDYDLRDTEAGRYQATELLDQLRQSSAKTKLLVMDTGWILSDPRLGMLANEFPLLLANDIAGQDDPGLWVLLSCSALESPTVLFAEQQTVFGQCFADGLLGSADLWDRGGNDDGFVSLDELFTFVFTACRQATAGVQTPMLLHAGTRLDQITSVPAGIQLARANLQAREDQAEDAEEDLQKTPPNKKKENTATTQTKSSAEVADLATSDLATSDLAQSTAMAEPAQIESEEGVNAQEESPPANGTGQSAAVRGQPSDMAKTAGRTHAGQLAPDEQVPLPELLYRAWQLRDRLEALPDTSGRWSPIEYAPLQWRELNALLLDIDQRSRAGNAFDQTRLRGQLKTHLDGLTRLAQEENIDAFDGDQSLVVDRLLIVANRFAGSTERASFATKSRKLREVGKAVRYFYRATFRLSDYLRCHREIVVGWADYPSVQDITRQLDLLADGLLRFQHELHDREGERLIDSSAEDAIVVLARSLSETEANLKTMFQTLGETLTANSNQAVNRDRVVGLLQTSIWNAEQRQRLTTCLNRPLAPARLAPSDSAILPQQWPVSARIGEQLAQHAALQLKVFELAGVATPEITPQLAAFDAARRSLSVGDRHFWQEARLLGQTCKSLYLALSEQIQSDSPATAIRCLDARDADDWALADQRDFFPRLGLLPPREPDRLDVVQKPAGLLRLKENPVVVDMEVRPSNPGMRFVTVTPNYDDSRLRVACARRR